MQVLTLDPEAFRREAARLAEMVHAAHPAQFDLVVGIRTGGAYVCDAMAEALPFARERHDVSLQRPSTKRKEGRLGNLLTSFPTAILDIMRMAESIMLSARHRFRRKTEKREVDLNPAITKVLDSTDSPEILIVDDAIDSGATAAAVRDALMEVNPSARIQTAVITVTTSQPEIRPEYALYSNHTLIRFPWSKDFKQKKQL